MEALIQFLASCEFSTPLYFWIGAAVVLLFLFLPWARKRGGLAIDLHYWKRQVTFKSRRLWILAVPEIIASVLIAGGLSGPEYAAGSAHSVYGKPVMIVLDVSGSMSYQGPQGKQKVSGFEKARGVFYDLIARRPDVSFGLLLYSTEHYVARDFLYKNELFQDTVENKEEVDLISSGTRGDEAMAVAREFLVHNLAEKADKAIVLISDLEVDLEALLGIAEEAHRASLAGIKVYVIAVVDRAYVGRTEQAAAQDLRIVDMNDRYGIDQICDEISRMRMSPIREEEVLIKKSMIPFLIMPVLGLVALCLVLSETRFRKIP